MLPGSKRADARQEAPAVASPEAAAASPLSALNTTSSVGFGVVWLLTLIGCAALFEGLTFGWINDFQREEPAWMDVMYRQKELLMARTAHGGKRLVVVGGSGTLFGIDGELLEKKLHVPTVNFGTHAGLGLRYLLDRVQNQLQPGDTVLLAAEYNSWIDNYRDRPGPALWYMRTYDKRYLMHMALPEMQQIVWNTPLSDFVTSYQGWQIRKKGQPFYVIDMSFYCYAAMSPNGDLRVTLAPHADKTTFYPFPNVPPPAAVETFRNFSRYARDHGVRLMMTCPNFVRPQTEVAASAGPPTWAADLWRECGWTLLDSPSETAFPQPWFMDSDSHPNPPARRIRTERVLNHLRPYFGAPAVPQKPNGIFLVAGTTHRLTDGNIFANDPGVECRYLQPPGERADDPSAITPEQVAAMVRAGVQVRTDSEVDAAALLAPLGMELRLSSHGAETLGQWMRRYPSNVICVAAAPEHPLDPAPWEQTLPPQILAKIVKPGPTLAFFGTGHQARPITLLSDSPYLYQQFEVREAHKTRKQPPVHLAMQGYSKEGGGPFGRIEVDYKDFVKSPTGICIVALDMQMGTVVGQAIYQGGADIETWRLYDVAFRNHPATGAAAP